MVRASWALLLVVAVLCVYLLVKVDVVGEDLARLERRVLLLRVLTPGRTKEEVIWWLGEPAYIQEDVRIPDGQVEAVMVYKSSPRRMNGMEDIWVVLDDQKRVATVYYPDFPVERAIVSAKWRPPQGAEPIQPD